MGGAVAKDGDQARAIGYQWTPGGEETLYIRSRVLLDARAAGVPYPVGGMWTAVDDPDGLRRFAIQTRQLGYAGMMVAHYPGHIPTVNEVFTPTAAELAHHREVIRIVGEGEARGASMQEKDGHIVDPAMVKLARDRLALARRLGVPGA
jgi:citrate lyase subunit beta/citryl-CoA lyase